MEHHNLLRMFDKFPEELSRTAEALSRETDYEVAATPADVVYSEDKTRLLHYRSTVPHRDRHPIPALVVYALINRYILLDLEPGRSFVQNLLNQGVDVWLIDWGYPSGADRYLDMNDYVNHYMDKAVDTIRSETGNDQINLMGICMGGTFVVIYTALHPEKVRSLASFAAPIDADVRDSLLFTWAKRLDPDKILDAFGNLPGELANILYLLAIPVDAADRYIGLCRKADNPDFIRTFLRLEKWSFDSPDMAGEVFRDYIRDIFQKNLLINNRLTLNGNRADLRYITCPLFNAFGTYDHLVPPASSKPLSTAVSSEDVHTVEYKTGHIGMFVGKNSRNTVIPEVASWIKAR